MGLNFSKGARTLCAICAFFLPSAFVHGFSARDIISPAPGTWANRQALVLNVEEGTELYYSLSGTDPFVSGFAYDGPVMIDQSGDVCVKITVIDKGRRNDFEVKCTVRDGDPTPNEGDGSQVSSFVDAARISPLKKYISGSIFKIPEGISYSLNRGALSHSGDLSLSVKNCLDRYVPFTFTDGFNDYHCAIHVVPAVDMESIARNKKAEIPFEVLDWENIILKNPRYFYCVDGGMWTGQKTTGLKREIDHRITFQSSDYKADNPVYVYVLPKKPEFVQRVMSDGSVAFAIKESSRFTFGNRENSFGIDIFNGEELKTEVSIPVYLDGFLQGHCTFDVDLDKLAPEKPSILVERVKGRGAMMKVRFESRDASDSLHWTCDKPYVLGETSPEFTAAPEDYRTYGGGTIELKSIFEKGTVYPVHAYARDKKGNMSSIATKLVIVDELNCYLKDGMILDEGVVPDGSFDRPFTSFDQAVEYINSNPGNTRLFIDGTVRITGGQKRITGECTFYGSNCNLVFDRDSSMVFSGQKVRFEDCIIYNETSFESQVENLLSLENASAEFKNCEISFVANENGAAIKSSGSAVVCRDTGITVQAGDGGCCIDSAVSVVRTDRCRLTVTSPSSCGIRVNNGQGIITGCTVYVSGNSGRGIEFINSKAAIQKCSITASLKDRTASSQAVYMDENTSTLLNDDLDVKGF